MNDVAAILFSTLEVFSMLYFATSLFKINITKTRFIRLALICLSFAIFSIEMKIYDILPTIMPFLQIGIIMFLVNKFLKIKIKTTSIMIGVSWITFIGGQTLLMLLLDHYNLIKVEEIQKLSVDGYILQLSSFIIFMGVGIITRVIREGYIIDFDNTKIKFRYSYKIMAGIISGFYFILIVLSAYIFNTHNINYICVFCVLICIFTFVMLILLLERDKEEVKKSFSYFLVEKGGKQNEIT